MSDSAGGDYGLETISDDGKVPETRMRSASQVQDFVRRLTDNDEKRSKKRALVNGLVGGNPPYKTSKLRAAGRADACNVNWGTARTYLEAASGAFYDLSSEAPGMIGILTSIGHTPQEAEAYSRTMSGEADAVLMDDPSWDFEMQVSQEQMTAHGCGPLIFEDFYTVLPVAVSAGDLKVPERTKADTKYFEVASVDRDYYPPDLYRFIECEEAATAAGWDVEYTKKVISNAMDIRQPESRSYDWEFYQQEIKNNSLTYYDDSKVCHLALVWWKEFDGTVTQAIVERDNSTDDKVRYLFFHRGRYSTFRQCVHPMYFDRGQGGYHHSVTGGGVKCFGPLEYENRLLCNLFDKTFAPKILFKPTSVEAGQKFQMTTFGDWGMIPAGMEAIQVPLQGFVNDGLQMYNTSTELMRSNMSSYRQQVAAEQPGNPPTKFQKQLEASQQSALSKTTFNRYYRQLDALYAEITRRLCDLNTTDDRAMEFQERCRKKGVPGECFGRITQARAVRVIGQGSAFMRKTAVDALMPVVGSLPESGKKNWLDDKIACEAGQTAVARYNPPSRESRSDDQNFMAMSGVTMMKAGVPPPMTDGQNSTIFAMAYLQAATKSMQSLQQGASPMQILPFLELIGPAIGAHLKRLEGDPLRKDIFEALKPQFEKLASMTERLKKMVQQQAQKAKQAKQGSQQEAGQAQVEASKAKAEIEMKQAKTKSDIQMKQAKTKSDIALADAKAASELHRKTRQSALGAE